MIRVVGYRSILYSSAIIFKKGVPAEFQYAENSFFYDSLIHFGNTQFTVFKNDGHFYYFKTEFPGGKFHFNLECVTREMNFIQVDRLQYILPVTYKTRSR